MHVNQLSQRLHFTICRFQESVFVAIPYLDLGTRYWLAVTKSHLHIIHTCKESVSLTVAFWWQRGQWHMLSKWCSRMAVITKPLNSRRPNHTKQCIALQCKSHLHSHQACSQDYSNSVAQRQIVEMLIGPPPVPVCSMKRGLCQLQLAAYGMMSYQVWGNVYAYFILLHPSSSKLIFVFTKLLPQVLNCLQVCLLFEQALLPLSLWVHRHPLKANMSHHVSVLHLDSNVTNFPLQRHKAP